MSDVLLSYAVYCRDWNHFQIGYDSDLFDHRLNNPDNFD